MDKKSKSPVLPESYVKEALADYDKRYTYTDYVTWDDDIRWELIRGIPYKMSAPSRRHQEVSGRLYLQLATFLKGKSCKVYYAPFDVRLNFATSDNTVVQPDIVIVCDQTKLNDAGCAGVPDMVIEILSPSTTGYDRTIKFNTYRDSGVREYWIVDPDIKTLAVYILKEGDYITRPYTDKNQAPVHTLEGCTIDLSEVFEE